MSLITKNFPVFDCDAHITELPAIWDHVPLKDRELVKQSYWAEGMNVVVNGRDVTRGQWDQTNPIRSVVECSGPGTNKKIIRKLRQMPLTDELLRNFNYAGAREPHARVKDLDLLGIDQVVVIPIMMFNQFPWVENVYAADAVARAYNDWVNEWCSQYPDRLFPSACLPLQSPELSVKELNRVAKEDFRLAMVRPTDQLGKYPNQAVFDPVWRAFEETGMVVAMHSLATAKATQALAPHGHPQWSPGLLLENTINEKQMMGPSQSLSFVHEAMVWVTNVMLSGFLEKYPKLPMAVMESNATWLPLVLEECDKAMRLYKSQRNLPMKRMPSELFEERCYIAFEGDEEGVYRQHKLFENIGIWSSDVYHHDGADCWSAMREMEEQKVPPAVVKKLMGENARRMYRIEPKMFVTKEPASYERPAWYPTKDAVSREYAHLMRVS